MKRFKSFKRAADQLERIYALYLKGFGTRHMLARAERFMFEQKEVGLCF